MYIVTIILNISYRLLNITAIDIFTISLFKSTIISIMQPNKKDDNWFSFILLLYDSRWLMKSDAVWLLEKSVVVDRS